MTADLPRRRIPDGSSLREEIRETLERGILEEARTGVRAAILLVEEGA